MEKDNYYSKMDKLLDDRSIYRNVREPLWISININLTIYIDKLIKYKFKDKKIKS